MVTNATPTGRNPESRTKNKMNSANYTELPNSEQRIIARIAGQARIDTITGGAKALCLAKRLPRLDASLGLTGIVSNVYALSSGRHHPDYEAWECPECGSAHLGQDAAYNCCTVNHD